MDKLFRRDKHPEFFYQGNYMKVGGVSESQAELGSDPPSAVAGCESLGKLFINFVIFSFHMVKRDHF